MASLYFFGKYVMLAIVVVLSNSIWCPVSCCVLIMLIAWCVLAWCHVDVLLFLSWPFFQFLQCTCPEEQSILYLYSCVGIYTPAELSGGFWSLGFLKICPIFLSGLKIIRILYLFNILSIRSVLLTYGRMNRILSSDFMSETHRCLVYMFIDYFDCLFCVRFSIRLFLSDWILSVDILCQR